MTFFPGIGDGHAINAQNAQNAHGSAFQDQGAQNYYADNCLRCGKLLEIQEDGEHEDEWCRGYCYKCAAYLQAGVY